MSLTREDLEKLELPVEIIDKRDGEIRKVICLGSDRYFYEAKNHGALLGCYPFLSAYKLKPKTKKITVERWVNVYPNGITSPHRTEEEADSFASSDRIACEHFVKEYEVECDEIQI
jgi:hypothetical protein